MKRYIVITLLFILVVPVLIAEVDEYSREREWMVKRTLEARGIKDPVVLDAMRSVKRHLFVPEYQRSQAYADHPLPIGEGQTISQPYIVALMTDELKLKPDDKVLEIGTGSGYQAAVLAEIVNTVYSIEIIKSLADSADKRLKELGYENINVLFGDGYKGWPEHAPFDAIIVTCAPDKIPPPLLEQLAEGGRMIIPIADSYPQRLVMVTKNNGEITKETILGVMFVPMTGEAQKPRGSSAD